STWHGGPGDRRAPWRTPGGIPILRCAPERRAMSGTEGEVTWDGHRTWYRQRGELASGGPAPIVLLHGGPGGTHDYLEPLLALGDSGRPVVLYDQLGNGRSEHLRDAP